MWYCPEQICIVVFLSNSLSGMLVKLEFRFTGSGKLADMVDNKVISLDLVASRPSVIACNMAHVRDQISSVLCPVHGWFWS